MMTIDLTDDIERFILDAVRTGRYARADDVVADALIRLRKAMEQGVLKPEESAEARHEGKPLTKGEFHRHLVEIGLLSPIPETHAEPEDGGEPLIDHEGEVVSEMVIRERLIEWLVRFL